MFEFIQRFFGKPASSATAKERLRLVLLSDHLSLAPDVVEALKHDLIDVISRYVDVDAANCDVTFEQQDKQVAMLANIPILGMRSRSPPSAARPAAPAARAASPVAPPSPEPEPPPSLGLGGATASVTQPETVPAATSLTESVPVEKPSAAVQAASGKPEPAKAANGSSRRRRRKRPGTTAIPSAG